MGDGVLVPGEFVLAYMEALASALTEAELADALPAFIRRMDPVFAGLMSVVTRDVLMSEDPLRANLNFHLKSGEVVRFEAALEFFCLYEASEWKQLFADANAAYNMRYFPKNFALMVAQGEWDQLN